MPETQNLTSFGPTRYRKKPVEIEAVQLTYDNEKDVLRWIRVNGGTASFAVPRGLDIKTLESHSAPLRAEIGDYIICGVEREFYPCKPAIFEASYERA